ncbi:hypothetical protein D3C71_1484450 [compost metagenome]
MVAGRKTRKHLQPAALQIEVVFATYELHAPQFEYAQIAFVGAVVLCVLVQVNHPVRDTVKLLVALARRLVVQHENSAIALGKKALERQYLAAVPQRALRQQAQFRQAVENDTVRLEVAHQPHYRVGRLPQFKVGGVQDGLLSLLTQTLVAHQVVHLHSLQRPAM